MNPIGMKRISKPPNGVILNELIGIWCLQGVYLGTLVFGKSVLKGSQSDLFVRTVVHVCGYNGVPCVRLFPKFEYLYSSID